MLCTISASHSCSTEDTHAPGQLWPGLLPEAHFHLSSVSGLCGEEGESELPGRGKAGDQIGWGWGRLTRHCWRLLTLNKDALGFVPGFCYWAGILCNYIQEALGVPVYLKYPALTNILYTEPSLAHHVPKSPHLLEDSEMGKMLACIEVSGVSSLC